MIFNQKYLKYKTKYINLKSLIGGSNTSRDITTYTLDTSTTLRNCTSFLDFCKKIKLDLNKPIHTLKILNNTDHTEVNADNFENVCMNGSREVIITYNPPNITLSSSLFYYAYIEKGKIKAYQYHDDAEVKLEDIAKDVKTISVGNYYIAAITVNGSIYCWSLITSLLCEEQAIWTDHNYETIVQGDYYTAAITIAGKLYHWTTEASNPMYKDITIPEIDESDRFIMISAYNMRFVAITFNNKIVQFGYDNRTKIDIIPTELETEYKMIALYRNYVFAIDYKNNIVKLHGIPYDTDLYNNIIDRNLKVIMISVVNASILAVMLDRQVIVYDNKSELEVYKNDEADAIISATMYTKDRIILQKKSGNIVKLEGNNPIDTFTYLSH